MHAHQIDSFIWTVGSIKQRLCDQEKLMIEIYE